MVDWLNKKNGTIAVIVLYLFVLFMVFFVEFDNRSIPLESGDNIKRTMINIDMLVSSVILALIPLYYGILTYIKKKSILKSLLTVFLVTLFLVFINLFTFGGIACIDAGEVGCYLYGIFINIFFLLFMLIGTILLIIGLLFHKYYYKK